MLASQIFGGGAGAHVGSYAVGALAGNPNYLPLDGRTYLKADYPDLDTSAMLTFGGNTLVTRQTLSVGTSCRLQDGNGLIVAWPEASNTTTYYTSADDGVTFTARTAPVAFVSQWGLGYANGVWFIMPIGVNSFTCYTSPDCITWTARAMPSNYTLAAAGYVGGQYVLVAGTNNSPYAVLYRSADLAAWTFVSVGMPFTAANFAPSRRSLLNHPTLGCVFSFYDTSAGTTYVCSTTDGVYISTRRIKQSDGAAMADMPSRSIVADDCGALVSESYEQNTTARGVSTGLLMLADYGNNSSGYGLMRGRKNLMKQAWQGSSGLGISEDFGRTVKAIGLDAGSRSCISPTRMIACTGSGVIKTLDIDSARFAAVGDTFNFQDFNHQLYVRAR